MYSITLQQAIEFIKKGEIIAIPTDTVYGLAANIFNEFAIDKIFDLKQRPLNNPLVVQLAFTEQIYSFIDDIPLNLKTIINNFWPGALTIVLEVIADSISSKIRAGLKTVAFRIPANTLTLELLKSAGPLVATSANPFGKPSATLSKHVETYFPNIPILKQDSGIIGIESTIIAHIHNCKWRILREGAICRNKIKKIIGKELIE